MLLPLYILYSPSLFGLDIATELGFPEDVGAIEVFCILYLVIWSCSCSHRRTGRGVRGGQLTPQFGQIHDIYSGKRQHIFGQKTTHLFH